MASFTVARRRYLGWPNYLQQLSLSLALLISLELVLLYGHRTETINSYLTSYARSLIWLNLLVLISMAQSERRLKSALITLVICLIVTLAVYAGFSSIVLGEGS